MKYSNSLKSNNHQTFALWIMLVLLTIAGCSSTQHKPDAHSANEKTFTRSTPAEYSTGQQIVAIAESMIGSPYRYGGASPSGFDCSGLVYYTHQQLDITVPRTTTQQARFKSSKKLSAAQPGDILFFKIYGSNVSHVGIYTGNNQFVHAPKSGKYVSYASLDEAFWKQRLVKVATLH